MDESDFRRQLDRDGYSEICVVTWDADTVNDSHAHDFSARGLILTGSFVLRRDSGEQQYRPGDIFELEAGTPHVETVGPDGASFLVGRKSS